MSARVDLNLPRSVWTANDSRILALNTVASIKMRTSRGIDANDKKFTGYSTTPLYVSVRGAKLRPKGGRPSSTGQSVYYQGGYKEYKNSSRRRTAGGAGQSAEVDLVLSGALMNNLVVKEATQDGFTIGLTKHVSHYGYRVNEDREYIGLTDKEVDILVEAVEFDIRAKL